METLADLKIKNFERPKLEKSFRTIDWQARGRISGIVGNLIEAYLPGSRIGTVASIDAPNLQGEIIAEVVGFRKDTALLLPYSSTTGISTGSTVFGLRQLNHIEVGSHLLGRVLDGMLKPLDGKDLLTSADCVTVPIEKVAPNPMGRDRVENIMGMGIRVIDSLLTFGVGQRVGIMAGSGVGKSVLLGMIAKGSIADINIIGLIGERGREVKEFIERDLGPEGLKKSIVVVVTGDQSPLLRIRAAKTVTALAEFFSGMGKNVLLMMDSLTRVAMAQREIGLAVGEPPTTKGYPPSVFSLLPSLLERCGPQGKGLGAISGLYTVLVDGDDFNDPIPDAARSILDGHINLSRALAARGHFPAIEVNTSASRVMHDVVQDEHWQYAQKIRGLLGVYQENYDFIQLGSYQGGMNPQLDLAIRLMPSIEKFLKQDIANLTTYEDALNGMKAIFTQQLQFEHDVGV